MKVQADKHRTDTEFTVGQQVWVSSRDIKTTRPSRTLEDKLFGPYEIIKKVGTSYRLKLPKSFRQSTSFHPSKLYLDPNNPLPGQRLPPPQPVVLDNTDEWELDDIVDSRVRHGKLQYKCQWTNWDRDDDWYNVNGGNFDNAQKIVEDFHERYPRLPR